MSDEVEADQRANRILEQRVKRETIVDSRLDGHDRKFGSINGQIERGAKATEMVAERVLKLDQRVDTLTNELRTKAAIDQALRDKADVALRQQITRREFWMGVIVIVVAILSIAVNSGLL